MTFSEQVLAWSSPPVDDVGYIPSASLLKLTDEELIEVITTMEQTRYGGWRNYDNRWRDLFALDTTEDSFVLDYGCGVGLEALQYARYGNKVVLADISVENLALASRTLRVFGYQPHAATRLPETVPINLITGPLDVIHCAGVLHHIPNDVEVMEAFSRWLKPDGEVRLMLYSDEAWKQTTGTSRAPTDTPNSPHFQTFVRAMDGVGAYADWYSVDKVKERFGEWFEVKYYDWLTENNWYLGVVLVKR